MTRNKITTCIAKRTHYWQDNNLLSLCHTFISNFYRKKNYMYMATQYSTKPLESLMAENLGHSRDFSTFIVNKIMKHRD